MASMISLTCFKDEIFTVKSPWLLAAARRDSALSLRTPAIVDLEGKTSCETKMAMGVNWGGVRL